MGFLQVLTAACYVAEEVRRAGIRKLSFWDRLRPHPPPNADGTARLQRGVRRGKAEKSSSCDGDMRETKGIRDATEYVNSMMRELLFSMGAHERAHVMSSDREHSRSPPEMPRLVTC